MSTKEAFLSGILILSWPGLIGAATAPAATSVTAIQSEDDIEALLVDLKPETLLEINLRSGKTVQGRLISYDDYYDTLWIRPFGGSKFLDKKSYRLSSLMSVRQVTEKEKTSTEKAVDLDSRYLLLKPE